MIHGILVDEAGGAPRIRELEVSITQRCNLACAQCGFMVPNQPPPAYGDVSQEAAAGLKQLGRLGIRIGTLVVLGGEPTLDGNRLVRTLRALRGVGNFDRLEVVSNGLHPQGLTEEALRYIDRFVISVYFDDPALSELWRRWLTSVAPHVELQLRVHADGWDRWTGDEKVDEGQAQQLYDACWYRKHCITVERGRLFACSRIPKLSRHLLAARRWPAIQRLEPVRRDDLPDHAGPGHLLVARLSGHVTLQQRRLPHSRDPADTNRESVPYRRACAVHGSPPARLSAAATRADSTAIALPVRRAMRSSGCTPGATIPIPIIGTHVWHDGRKRSPLR